MNQRIVKRGMGDVSSDYYDYYSDYSSSPYDDPYYYDDSYDDFYDPSQDGGYTKTVKYYPSQIYMDADGYRVDRDGYYLDGDGRPTTTPFQLESPDGGFSGNPISDQSSGDWVDPSEERRLTLILQTQLNQFPSALPRLAVDGNWGSDTQARLEEFQRQHGLTVTGWDDDQTYTVLAAGYTPTTGGGAQQNNNNQSPKPRSNNPFASLTTNEKYALGGGAALLVLVLAMGEHSKK
jgi:hypothetical protein